MEKNNKEIFINLQIAKDAQKGRLSLHVVFDKNADNFSMDKNSVSWSPTYEEIDFIVEAFAMISKQEKSVHPLEKETEKPELPTSKPDVPEPKTTEPLKEQEDDTAVPKEEVTFEPDTPVAAKTEDSSSKLTDAKLPPKSNNQIFIPASDQAIDDALKRKKEDGDDDFIVEASEKAILDKVLSHKKKKL